MGSLKSSLYSGIAYTAIAKYTGLVIGIVVSMILARLISPEDFGIIAIATVFISFFAELTTVGISPAIIQNKTITEEEIKRINSITFYCALILSCIYLLSLPILLSFYDNNAVLKKVLLLLVINVFFSVASIVPNALILKNKLFKFIAIRTLIIQVILGVVSVTCALCGMGIYALVISPIGSSIILFAVNFSKMPVGFLKPSKKALDKIFSFSVFQSLFNFVIIIYRSIDKMVIGKTIGLDALGYYEKSYRLMLLPLDNVSSVISPVLHPILSEYQNNDEVIWNSYIKIIRSLAEFAFILSFALFFLAEPIIMLMYGPNWQPAVPVFKVLALSAGIQIIQSPVGPVLQSINKVKGLFYGSLCMLLFIVLALSVSLIVKDIYYVAIAMVIAFYLGFFVYQFFAAHFFNKRFFDIIRAIIPFFAFSIPFFVICYTISLFIVIKSVWLSLLVYSLITIIYVITLILCGKMPNTKELLLSLWFKMKQRHLSKI